MATSDFIYQTIFENMRDGVMTLEAKGRVSMFNQAAADILGISREAVLGGNFAELFVMGIAGNDTFNQLILDAIYQSGIGQSSRVEFTRPDQAVVHLLLTPSYLKRVDAGGGAIKGLIVVFTDITEIEHLRQQEGTRNEVLLTRCQQAEATNQTLQHRLAQRRFTRISVSLLALLLLVTLGTWFFGKRDNVPLPASAPPVAQPVPLPMTGHLVSTRPVHLTAPLSGMIVEQSVEFGQAVEAGALLARLHVAELETTLHQARVAHLEAKQAWLAIKVMGKAEQVALAHDRFLNAQTWLEILTVRLGRQQLYAPVSGVLVRPLLGDPRFDQPLAVGMPIRAGERLGTIIDPQQLAVQLLAERKALIGVRVDQSATIFCDLFPEIRMAGRVTGMSYQTGSEKKGRPLFAVKVGIEQVPEALATLLRPGMAISVEIQRDDHPAGVTAID